MSQRRKSARPSILTAVTPYGCNSPVCEISQEVSRGRTYSRAEVCRKSQRTEASMQNPNNMKRRTMKSILGRLGAALVGAILPVRGPPRRSPAWQRQQRQWQRQRRKRQCRQPRGQRPQQDRRRSRPGSEWPRLGPRALGEAVAARLDGQPGDPRQPAQRFRLQRPCAARSSPRAAPSIASSAPSPGSRRHAGVDGARARAAHGTSGASPPTAWSSEPSARWS